ncbi:MAG: EamA family transporter [Paludibacteraceae bacterium]|nr:EamA family transporter [Paludibacteraceae bacterium]
MKIGKLISLIIVNLLYAIVLILNRFASIYAPLSLGYILLLGVSVIVLAIYAISWQQIIKRMPISDAYMFKGTSIVFVLLLTACFFEEIITWQNIVGSILIILGIALFAKVDKEVEA